MQNVMLRQCSELIFAVDNVQLFWYYNSMIKLTLPKGLFYLCI